MTLPRRFVGLGACLSLALGCGGLTDPSPDLVLTLSRVDPEAGGSVLSYQFTVANRGDAPVFVPACNHSVHPDFTLEGPEHQRDGVSGSLCIAILDMSPVRVAPGTVVAGQGAVIRRVGVRYTPSLSYSIRSDMASSRTVRAPSFLVQ